MVLFPAMIKEGTGGSSDSPYQAQNGSQDESSRYTGGGQRLAFGSPSKTSKRAVDSDVSFL